MELTIEEAKGRLRAGCKITCIRPKYSNSVHIYTLVKDVNEKGEPFKLLSEGYKLMSGFKSFDPTDAISYLEGGGLNMKIVKITSPSRALYLYAEKTDSFQ